MPSFPLRPRLQFCYSVIAVVLLSILTVINCLNSITDLSLTGPGDLFIFFPDILVSFTETP